LRFLRDLLIALVTGLIIALVVASTGKAHLVRVLWFGLVGTGVVLAGLLVWQARGRQIQLSFRYLLSYLPGVELRRPSRRIKLARTHRRVTGSAELAESTPGGATTTPVESGQSDSEEDDVVSSEDLVVVEPADEVDDLVAVEPEDEVDDLIAEGEALKNELLVARRTGTTSMFGGSSAVNAVALRVRDWNRRVAEAVDASDMSFNQKMSFDIYHEPALAISGASAQRAAEVLEGNLRYLFTLRDN
jgi:hypothetical protein